MRIIQIAAESPVKVGDTVEFLHALKSERHEIEGNTRVRGTVVQVFPQSAKVRVDQSSVSREVKRLGVGPGPFVDLAFTSYGYLWKDVDDQSKRYIGDLKLAQNTQLQQVAQEIRYRKSHHPDTPPLYPNDPHAKAVSDAGGALRYVTIPKHKPGPNGGCGGPANVPGTNGGTFPCGSVVNVFGDKKPYYCEHCKDDRNAARPSQHNPQKR